MFVTLTTTYDTKIWVSIDSIQLMEQEGENTRLTLSNGGFLLVRETPSIIGEFSVLAKLEMERRRR